MTSLNYRNEKLESILKQAGMLGSSFFGFDLSKVSSIGTGGKCACFINAQTRNGLLKFLKQYVSGNTTDLKIYPVGSATNILFADGFLPFLMLKLGHEFDYIGFLRDGSICAGAAFKLPAFVVQAAKKGYDFSFLAGIPGTLGGAVMGSSGTSSKNINSTVERISYIEIVKGSIKESEMLFSESDYAYRHFKLPGTCLITDIFFRKVKKTGDRKDIFQKIRENIKRKKELQPLNTKNIGCIFKNLENGNISAGKIIDECGFKGFKYGGAEVSQKHANFIVNRNSTESKDIYTLAEIVREAVRQKYETSLEYEIKFVGF